MRVRAGLGEKSAARSPGKTKPVTRRRKLPPENRFFPAHNHSAFPPPPRRPCRRPAASSGFFFLPPRKKAVFCGPRFPFFSGLFVCPQAPVCRVFLPLPAPRPTFPPRRFRPPRAKERAPGTAFCRRAAPPAWRFSRPHATPRLPPRLPPPRPGTLLRFVTRKTPGGGSILGSVFCETVAPSRVKIREIRGWGL